MTDHYVTTTQVAHLWAHQAQDWAKGGNLSYRGTKIRSYWLVIGNIVNNIALIRDTSYSPTTIRHRRMAQDAVRGVLPYFIVQTIEPNLDAPEEWQKLHSDNITSMLNDYATMIVADKRKTNLPTWHEDEYHLQITKAREYAIYFAITKDTWPDPTADWTSVVEHHRARRERNNTPTRIAARKRAAERKALAEKD